MLSDDRFIGMLFTTTYWEMMLVAISLGVAKGVRNVYMSIVIPSYIPLDRLASASGIQMFANGLAMMFLGPVLGEKLLTAIRRHFLNTPHL